MLNNYEKFLEEFDLIIKELFDNHKQYIKCQKGCSLCCTGGEFPYSQLEFTYLTKGFINLPNDKKQIVQNNIKNLLKEKSENTGERFEHTCPFLINNECSDNTNKRENHHNGFHNPYISVWNCIC